MVIYTLSCAAKNSAKSVMGPITDEARIPNRIGIEQRPLIVDQKGRICDWEGDTITDKGHKGK